MNRIFVSHPFSDNPKLRKKQVDYICKKLKEKGLLPISPLHLFDFIEKETPELRSEILDVCTTLIDTLNIDRVYCYDYGRLSSGQKFESRFTEARNHNEKREIKIVEKKPPQKCREMEW